MIESLLLTAVRIYTFTQQQLLTNATGFFFRREEKLFLVTCRHVMIDESSKHFPDRIEIELHIDANNLASSTGFSIPLYHDGKSLWRQGIDAAGEVDVAVIEIDQAALPDTTVYSAFTLNNLLESNEQIEVGTPLMIVGFPLGFHDTLHHLPIVRQGMIASSFGLRFQGEGFFITDARTHRGISGAPVVTRRTENNHAMDNLPWKLLGIHSARLDVGTRDMELDEALALNCSWYADILLTLTEG
jgi:S1-C subfamily serine protease